jgi:transcriptional regulator with XRE-family HTH domain
MTTTPDDFDLASRLRRLLDENGYSLSEAAERASMHRQQVHRLVSGENPDPRLSTLRRLLGPLGLGVGDLFPGEEDDHPRRHFACPHCGLEQTRVFPHPSGNPCNGCQRDMD